MFKVKFCYSETPKFLVVSENGIGMPAIVGDVTGGKVHSAFKVKARTVKANAGILRPQVKA